MNRLRFFATGVSFLALAACTTTGNGPGSANYPDTTSAEAELMADFLIGAYADMIDDSEVQAEHYISAFERDPTDSNLARRAITSAIVSGDQKSARKILGKIQANDVDENIADAFAGAEKLAKAQYVDASEFFDTPSNDLTVFILTNIMEGWSLAGQGKVDEARDIFQNLSLIHISEPTRPY